MLIFYILLLGDFMIKESFRNKTNLRNFGGLFL